MGAVNTPLYDLIEVTGINANQTYTLGMGNLLGFVDTATYTDGDPDNTATEIAELNDIDGGNSGTLSIDGVDYDIQLYAPAGAGNDVTIVADQGTFNLGGDGGTSQIVMMMATPTGGGAARYFFAVDDGVGDLTNISSIQTRGIDWDPAGNDVMINLDQNNNLTVCFTSGTLIETPDGPRPVEEIEVGDLVTTLDRGAMPVVWRHARRYEGLGEADAAHLRPVRVRRGSLQAGVPHRDLFLSPHHRIMVDSPIAQRMFGQAELLIPAFKLTKLPGISSCDKLGAVTYHHLFLGSHAVVFAHGAPVETFLPEPQALNQLPSRPRRALERLMTGPITPARALLESGPLLQEFLRRHKKNDKPLLRTRPEPIQRQAGLTLVARDGQRIA